MKVKTIIQRYGFDFIIFLAGALLPLAFSPINYFWLAWITPAILLAGLRQVTPKRAFIRGLLFGLGEFGVGVSWVYISIHVFGNTPIILSAFLTFLMVFILSLYPAIQGYLQARFCNQSSITYGLLIFPSLWMLLEWLRGWLFTGFPWLLIAYSQVNSPLRGFIPIVGEYGTGFFILVISGLLEAIARQLFALFDKSKQSSLSIKALLSYLILLIFIPFMGWCLARIVWTKPAGPARTVALVQGNIPQSIKWDPASIMPTILHYVDLTRPFWRANLIVWPEAAIPLPMPQAKEIISQLNNYAIKQNSTFITGIPVQVPQTFSYYNAMLLLGKNQGSYYKRHLVPFGEYVPFQNYLRGLFGILNLPMSDMTKGPQQQADLHADGIIIAPFICYEIAYWHELMRDLPRANLLVAITDDAWFGNSFAPAQQLQIGQFRALQSGRYLIQDGNNGITAIVNAEGVIIARVPQFKTAVLTGTVIPMMGATPWVTYGDIPVLWLLVLILILAHRYSINPKRSEN